METNSADNEQQQLCFEEPSPSMNINWSDDDQPAFSNQLQVSHSRKRNATDDLNDLDFLPHEAEQTEETDSEENEKEESLLDPIKDYNFQCNGKKKKKLEDKDAYVRVFFRCSMHSTPNKEDGCTARYIQNFSLKGEKLNEPEWNGVLHNHSPPTKKRMDKAIQDVIVQKLKNGMKTSQIHKDYVNAEENINATYFPTKKQISNMAHYLKRSVMPTGDAIRNILLKYSHFVQKLELAPGINIVFASQASLNLLKQYGQTLLVDGTFELCEGKLILTTFMVLVHGFGVPVCWFLTERKTTENYEDMFRYVKRLTGEMLSPQTVLCDFEDALRHSLSRVFPRALIYGDAFHVIQDNMKFLNRNKRSDLIPDMVNSLRILWASSSIESFAHNYKLFSIFWIKTYDLYATYFDRIWVKRYEPVSWAFFGRGPNVPSGDQPLEGWHNRLQNWVAPKSHEAIDYFTKMLWEECSYQEKLVTNPVLLEQRKKELEEVRKKFQKRATLASYCGRVMPQPPAALPGSISAPALPAPETEESVVESQSQLASITSADEVMVSAAESRQDSVDLIARVVNTNPVGTCSCGKKPRNGACSLKMCLKCCSQSSTYCVIASHRNAKGESNQENPLLAQIDKAIQKKGTLWLNYATAGKEPTGRPVQITGWKKKPTTFEGRCLRENIVKTYRVDRIYECSEQPLGNALS